MRSSSPKQSLEVGSFVLASTRCLSDVTTSVKLGDRWKAMYLSTTAVKQATVRNCCSVPIQKNSGAPRERSVLTLVSRVFMKFQQHFTKDVYVV